MVAFFYDKVVTRTLKVFVHPMVDFPAHPHCKADSFKSSTANCRGFVFILNKTKIAGRPTFKNVFHSFFLCFNKKQLFQVKVEFRSKKQESYDQCNTLVIPSTKRKTHKKKNNGPAVTKILSKTQRKKLEKIVERKKKKENVSWLVPYLINCSLFFKFIIK